MRRFAAALAGTALLVGIVAAYPAGAAKNNVFVARMNGEKEVSPEGQTGVGDADGTGNARVTLRPDQGEVCFRLNWKDIAAPTAAHIHKGKADEAGDVVVTLFSQDNALPATLLGVRGCADATAEVIGAIRRNPGGHYVNVHNSDFPGGAIRGQLRRPS